MLRVLTAALSPMDSRQKIHKRNDENETVTVELRRRRPGQSPLRCQWTNGLATVNSDHMNNETVEQPGQEIKPSNNLDAQDELSWKEKRAHQPLRASYYYAEQPSAGMQSLNGNNAISNSMSRSRRRPTTAYMRRPTELLTDDGSAYSGKVNCSLAADASGEEAGENDCTLNGRTRSVTTDSGRVKTTTQAEAGVQLTTDQQSGRRVIAKPPPTQGRLVDSEPLSAVATGISTTTAQHRKPPRRAGGGRQSLTSALLRGARSESNLKTNDNAGGTGGDGPRLCRGAGGAAAMLTDQQLYQIQLMYSGRATTRVVVCTCLANLYFADKRQPSSQTATHSSSTSVNPNKGSSPTEKKTKVKPRWDLAATGVPVLLLNDPSSTNGQRRASRGRQQQTTSKDAQMTVVLAEKGTGFGLWKDAINQQTRYTEVGTTFHTLQLSDDDTRQAGLSFDSSYAAMQFYAHVCQLGGFTQQVTLRRQPTTPVTPVAQTPNIDAAVVGTDASARKASRRHSFNSGSWARGKKSARGNSQPPIRKSDISSPCCFNHVTSLRPTDLNGDFSRAGAEMSGGTPVARNRAVSCIQICEPPQAPALMASPSSSV